MNVRVQHKHNDTIKKLRTKKEGEMYKFNNLFDIAEIGCWYYFVQLFHESRLRNTRTVQATLFSNITRYKVTHCLADRSCLFSLLSIETFLARSGD